MTTYTSQPDDTTGIDALISSLNPTTNYVTSPYFTVGERNDGANIYRQLVKFDLSSIPASAVILSASLELTVAVDYSSNARDFKIYRVLRDWVESQVTWNIWKTSNNWTTAGCGSNGNDADLTNVWATASMTASETVDSIKTFTFSATGITELTKMINGTYSNYGWLIKADTESDDCYYFHGSAAVTESYRPKLTILHGGGQVILWASE